MEDTFKKVQSKFSDLSILLNKLDLDNDGTIHKSLEKVNDVLTEAYILMNKSFCIQDQISEKCLLFRDQIGLLSKMIDLCESENTLNKESSLALIVFRENIPNVLTQMELVYQENIKKLYKIN